MYIIYIYIGIKDIIVEIVLSVLTVFGTISMRLAVKYTCNVIYVEVCIFHLIF